MFLLLTQKNLISDENLYDSHWFGQKIESRFLFQSEKSDKKFSAVFS